MPTLQKIIELVLTEKGMAHEEGIIRKLRRDFERLLNQLGGDKNVLKAGRRTMDFNDLEVPFMKVIIGQLYDGKGLIADFLDENSGISSKAVYDLIQSILDEETRNGTSEGEIKELLSFMNNRFQCLVLYYRESCHRLIDGLVANMIELPASLQAVYLEKVEHILKKEFTLRIAEMTYGISAVSQCIEFSKQECEDDIGVQDYSEFGLEIRNEYRDRDKQILAKLQQDKDLREYIEKIFGKRVEEIFNYAYMDTSK